MTGQGETSHRAIRGRRVAMVFQNPMASLDPLMTVGAQVAEVLRAQGVSRTAARNRAIELLGELGIANASRRVRAYPHEFSGGMRQRVVLAMALAADPDVLIADEPTTALDVRAQEQVLDLLGDVTRDRGLTVLLITHDLSVVAGFADRVVVMYAGRLVHEDPIDDTFARTGAPVHPRPARRDPARWTGSRAGCRRSRAPSRRPVAGRRAASSTRAARTRWRSARPRIPNPCRAQREVGSRATSSPDQEVTR